MERGSPDTSTIALYPHRQVAPITCRSRACPNVISGVTFGLTRSQKLKHFRVVLRISN